MYQAQSTVSKAEPYRCTWSGAMVRPAVGVSHTSISFTLYFCLPFPSSFLLLQIPDAVPYVSDMAYLRNQHVLLTVKKKGGQVLGQAEVPLWPGWSFLRHPVTLDSLTLAEVLQHPFLSEVYASHCEREHSPENLEFYRAVQQFKDDAALAASRQLQGEGKSDADGSGAFDIAEESQLIFEKYIAPTASKMVNLSSKSIATTKVSSPQAVILPSRHGP